MRRRLALAGAMVGIAVTLGFASPAFGYGTSGPVITTNNSSVGPGGSLTVGGTGFVDNESITLTLHSTPVVLATLTSSGAGTFSITVSIPSSTAPGAHQIIATGASGDSATTDITVTGAIVSTATSSGLAFTGADIAAVSAVGAVALGLGGFLLLAGKRRRTAAG